MHYVGIGPDREEVSCRIAVVPVRDPRRPTWAWWDTGAHRRIARRVAAAIRDRARFPWAAVMKWPSCGYLAMAGAKCRGTPDQIARYRTPSSGPLLDQLDLPIEVPAIAAAALASPCDRFADGCEADLERTEASPQVMSRRPSVIGGSIARNQQARDASALSPLALRPCHAVVAPSHLA